MCTYEDLVAATLPYGLSPLVVPQLKTITLGGAVTGLGIESTSFRNGLPHESVLEMDILTGTGDVVTASPEQNADLYPRLPEFLWHAGLFGSTEDRAGTRQAVRGAEAPAIPTRCRSWSRRWTGSSRPAASTARPVDYLDGVVFSADESYLCVGVQTTTPGPVSDYTGQAHLLPVDPARRHREARPADDSRLPVALGHRLVLVLAGIRRAEPEDQAVLAAALPAQQLLLEADRLRPALQHRRPDREAQRPAAPGARRAGRRGADRAVRRVPRLVPGQRADRADLAVPAAAARRRRTGRCTRSGRTTPTSTSVSGRRSRSGRRTATPTS